MIPLLLTSVLYKIELYLLKIIPIVLSIIYLLNIILSYYNINTEVLNLIGGMSFIPLLFIYISSFVFKFCTYHRLFLYYIIVNNLITLYDTYYTFTVNEKEFLQLHLIVAGFFLLLIFYLYLTNAKNNKRTAIKNHSRFRY